MPTLADVLKRAFLPQGMVEQGNITLANRPSIWNPEAGGDSTVYSESNGIDGSEVLYPRAADGAILSSDEAVQRYMDTGENLGRFTPRISDAEVRSPADRYAEHLHLDQQNRVFPETGSSSPYLTPSEDPGLRAPDRIPWTRLLPETPAPTESIGEEAAHRLARAVQGRADRHNQSLPPEVRGSQINQDLDHYLVGNEMAGPQYPMWERVGAVLPAVGHEVMRPLISANPSIGFGIGPSIRLVDVLNKVFGARDQPAWIAEGAGAGGAAAEPPVSLAGAIRNLQMLYRGATSGPLPGEGEEQPTRLASAAWGR